MATLTLRIPAAVRDGEAAPKAQGRGFWRRALDRMIEARMRRAEEYVRQHRYLMADRGAADDRFGLYDERTVTKDVGTLPFVR